MTRIHDCNAVNEVVQLLAEEGSEGMAQAIQIRQGRHAQTWFVVNSLSCNGELA